MARRTAWILPAVLLLALGGRAQAQASVFIPLGQPAHGELLEAEQWHGWLFSALAGTQVNWKIVGKDGLLPVPFLGG
jgi:hypothetical protein